MTQSQLQMILIGAAFIGAATCWLYAWSLCGPVGRRRMALGLQRRRGRHETGERPLYDGEPVRHLGRRSEAQRKAEYAALRREAAQSVASVSAAPLVDFTDELRVMTDSDTQPAVPPAVAALAEVISLHEELAAVEAHYAQKIRAAIARATPAADLTQEYALVGV